VRKWKEPDGRAAVWHLHGRLMRNAANSDWLTDGSLVLTEGDYARSAHAAWPEEFVAECLKDSLCVFVGLSMTDPNFIRWLYRHGAGSGQKHIAVFVRQAAPVSNRAVREEMERSAEARWRMAGVKPVWTNYYGEVAQLVHEVGLRATGEEHDAFPVRSQNRLAIGRRNLLPDDPKTFLAAQRDLSGWLLKRVDDVRAIALADGLNLASEELGLGLWAVNHERGDAELWGTSEQIWLDRRAVEARPIHIDSRWVGVMAITRGVSFEADPAVCTTRWRFIRGIPVIVEPQGQRSVVGALTLTAATEIEACPLSYSKAPAGLLSQVDRVLSRNAAEFFTE
jgi:hypothetical protein